MKPVATSLPYNDILEFKKGFPELSVKASLLGFVFGVLFTTSLNIPPEGKPFIFLLFIAVPFVISNKALKGDWPYQGWERFVGSFKIKASKNEEVFKIFDGNPFIMKSDDIFYSLTGAEVIAFELTSNEFSSINLSSIFKDKPTGSILQFLRVSKRIETKSNNSVKANLYTLYAVLELEKTPIPYAKFKEESISILENYGKRLSFEETYSLFVSAIYPNKKKDWESRDDIFHSPIRILREESLAHVGEIETKCLAVSLAKLPEKVGDNFQNILDVLNSLEGTVSVKFESLGDENALIALLRDTKLKKLGRLPSNESNRTNRVNLKLSLQALVHGTKQELDDFMYDLSRETKDLPQNEKPVFARENAYLKEAILNILPGRFSFELRKINVVSLDEALLYIPKAFIQNSKHGLIQMRTVFNCLYNFSYCYESPLYTWAGVGLGKSSLLTKILLTHLKRGREGESVASFSFEAGGTFKFLSFGLADVFLTLELDDQQNFLPLQDHPLRILLFFGDKGFQQAVLWIKELAEIDDSNAILLEIVADALKSIDEREKYNLKDFYKKFEELVKLRFPNSKENPINMDHSSRKALSSLKKFVDDKHFGKIFCPKKPIEFDLSKARHFYVSQIKADSDSPELLSGFFGLGLCLFNVLTKKFDTTSEHAADFLVQTDELHHLSNYLSYDQLRSINSQGRKQGKLITVASQSLSDSIKENDEEKYKFIESFRHFFFASGISSNEHLLKAVKISTSEEAKIFLSKFSHALDVIKNIRLRKKGWAWGYIDQFNNIVVIILDMEQIEQWLSASHPASQKLRDIVIKKTGFDFWKSCEMLALYGPRTLPKTTLPADEAIEKMLERIWNHGE